MNRSNDELIGYMLRDPQAALSRPGAKFNSWRNQMNDRIEQLKNEARIDLQ
jgi:hypothetical protein